MPTFKLEDGPYVRTNEVWTATDPELDALRVRLISDAGPKGKSTQELVKLTRGEPDPSLFKAPTDRTITEREGQAYSCGVKPGVAPATPRPAQ